MLKGDPLKTSATQTPLHRHFQTTPLNETRLKNNNTHENTRKTPAYPRQPRLSALMVLRQGKWRIFLACRGHVCVMADTRRHAANCSPNALRQLSLPLFLRRYWFSDGLTRCIGIPLPSTR